MHAVRPGCCLLALCLAAHAGAAPAYLGLGGEPLPFADDEAVLAFLRSAEVVAAQDVSEGVNRTLKLTLEQHGVRAHAAFRTVHDKRSRVRHGDTVMLNFEDSYRFEVAAYELSRLLGLDTVPPTVLRRVGAESGSLQLWVEGATSERARRLAGGDAPERYHCQMQSLRIFDRLISNFDRNLGNILIDGAGKLWWIDHTRSFRPDAALPTPSAIVQCELEIVQGLRSLDPGALRERLQPFLSKAQIRALLIRRERMLDHLETLAVRHAALSGV